MTAEIPVVFRVHAPACRKSDTISVRSFPYCEYPPYNWQFYRNYGCPLGDLSTNDEIFPVFTNKTPIHVFPAQKFKFRVGNEFEQFWRTTPETTEPVVLISTLYSTECDRQEEMPPPVVEEEPEEDPKKKEKEAKAAKGKKDKNEEPPPEPVTPPPRELTIKDMPWYKLLRHSVFRQIGSAFCSHGAAKVYLIGVQPTPEDPMNCAEYPALLEDLEVAHVQKQAPLYEVGQKVIDFTDVGFRRVPIEELNEEIMHVTRKGRTHIAIVVSCPDSHAEEAAGVLEEHNARTDVRGAAWRCWASGAYIERGTLRKDPEKEKPAH